MNSSKVKALVIVFTLFLLTGLVSVGCKQKPKNAWVNTSSLPGQTFANHSMSDSKQANPGIVYLGSNSSGSSSQSNSNFGPREVNFDFQNLK